MSTLYNLRLFLTPLFLTCVVGILLTCVVGEDYPIEDNAAFYATDQLVATDQRVESSDDHYLIVYLRKNSSFTNQLISTDLSPAPPLCENYEENPDKVRFLYCFCKDMWYLPTIVCHLMATDSYDKLHSSLSYNILKFIVAFVVSFLFVNLGCRLQKAIIRYHTEAGNDDVPPLEPNDPCIYMHQCREFLDPHRPFINGIYRAIIECFQKDPPTAICVRRKYPCEYLPHTLKPRASDDYEISKVRTFYRIEFSKFLRYVASNLEVDVPDRFTEGLVIFKPPQADFSLVFAGTGDKDAVCPITMSEHIALLADHGFLAPSHYYIDGRENELHHFPRLIKDRSAVITAINNDLPCTASVIPGCDVYFKSAARCGFADRRQFFDKFASTLWFDLDPLVPPPNCLPVFFGDEVRLLQPIDSDGINGTWDAPFRELVNPLQPHTSGALYCALTYSFPEIVTNRHLLSIDNVFCLFKVLLCRGSPPAIAWYNYIMLYGVKLYSSSESIVPFEFSWRQDDILNAMMIQAISSQSIVAVEKYTREMIRNSRSKERLQFVYKKKNLRHDWRILFSVVFFASQVHFTGAAKLDGCSPRTSLWFTCFVGCLILLPWNFLLSFIRRVVNLISGKKLSHIERIIDEVKRSFADPEIGFATEGGDDSQEDIPIIPIEDAPPKRFHYNTNEWDYVENKHNVDVDIGNAFVKEPPQNQFSDRHVDAVDDSLCTNPLTVTVSVPGDNQDSVTNAYSPVPILNEDDVLSQLTIPDPARSTFEEMVFSKWGISLSLSMSAWIAMKTIWNCFESFEERNYETAYAVFPFIMGIYSAPRPSQGATMQQIVLNYISFSIPFFTLVAKKIKEFPSMVSSILRYNTESSEYAFTEEWLKNAENIFEKWEDHKHTQLGGAFIELMSFALVAPLVKDKCKNIADAGLTGTLLAVQKVMLKESCSIAGVLKACVYVVRTFVRCVHTGELSTCLDLESEMLYADCCEYDSLMTNGTYVFTDDLTPAKIKMKYDLLEKKLVREVLITRGLGKKVAEERLIKVRTWLRHLSHHLKDGTPKEQPFSVYLYGDAGIGKSSLITNISAMLHHEMGWSDIEKLSTVVYGDKFASSASSATTAIFIDDAGNTLPEKRDIPVSQTAIDRCAAIYSPYLKADVDSKGCVLDCTKFCFWTSNTRDCGVHKETASYHSIIRRFGEMIFVYPKEGHGSILTDGLPDPVKMRQYAHEVIPSYLLYQRYTMILEGKTSPIMQLKGKPMDHYAFANHLRTACKSHFESQRCAMQRVDLYKRLPKCECGVPYQICSNRCPPPRIDSEASDPPSATTTATSWSNVSSFVFVPTLLDWLHLFGVLTLTSVWSFAVTYGICYPLATAITAIYGALYAHPPWEYTYWKNFFKYHYLTSVHHRGRTFIDLCRFHYIGITHELRRRTMWLGELPGFLEIASGPIGDCYYSCCSKIKDWKSAYVALKFYEKMKRDRPLVHTFVFGICRSPQAVGLTLLPIIFVQMLIMTYSQSQFAILFCTVFSTIVFATYTLAISLQRHVFDKMSAHPDEIRAVVAKQLLKYGAILTAIGTAYLCIPKIARQLRMQYFSEAGTFADPTVVKFEKVQEPIIKAVAKDWERPLYQRGVLHPTAKSMTLQAVLHRISKAMVLLEYDDGGVTWRVHGLFLNSTLMLMPNHFWFPTSGPKENMTVNARFRERNGACYTVRLHLAKNKSFEIEGKDMCVTMPNNATGDRPNLINLFPVKPPAGACLLTWYHFDRSFSELEALAVHAHCGGKYEHSGIMLGRTVTRKIDYGMEFKTFAPTFGGSCGSVLLADDKGVTIAGIYCAGTKAHGQGMASCVTLDEILNAEDHFRQRNLYLRPTERCIPVTKIGKYVVEAVPGIHPKNPVNFQTDLGVIHATVEKNFTPRAQTTPNLYYHESREELHIRDEFKAPDFNFNRVVQPLIAQAWKPLGCPDADLLEWAVNDFTKVVPEAVERAKLVKCEDGSQALITDRFLELDEVINGIEGNPLVPALNSATSAGFPYNLTKKKVLEGGPECWTLTQEDHQFYCEAWNRLSSGVSTGCVFNCTLKSEPRAIDKTGARAFQAVNLIGFLIVKAVLLPMMSVILVCPELFETVLGVNSLSPEWDRVIRELFLGGKWMSDEDYRKFDMSQVIELRMAAARVYVIIAQYFGWSEKMIALLEAVCCEFLRPLLAILGVIISTKNIMPSGSNITAEINGFGNSLAQRVSFRKRTMHSPIYGDFRSWVSQRNLGDDLLKSILEVLRDTWTPEMAKEDLIEFGLELTPGTKGDTELVWKPPCSPLGFLKRQTYYNEDMECLVGVLHPKSLLRPFSMHEKLTIPPNEYMLQICDNLVRECFFKGRNEFVACQSAVHALLRRIKLPIDAYRINYTYDQLLAEEKEKYRHIPRLPKPDLMSTEVSDEYLHFSSPRYHTEAGIEPTDAVKWVVGEDNGITPEIVARVYAGEHIISLMTLLKAFTYFEGVIIHVQTPFVPIYAVGDPNKVTTWNMILLSFLGIRGGVTTFFQSKMLDYVYSVERASALNATNFGTVGREVIHSTVNPVAVYTVPNYMTTRWMQVSGIQELRYIPQYNLQANRSSDEQCIFSRAAAEDFSLLNYRGPPILQRKSRRLAEWETEAGDDEVGHTTFAMSENVDTPDESPPAVRDPSVRVQDSSLARNWLQRPFPLATIALPVEQYVSVKLEPFTWRYNPIIKSHLRGVATMTVDLVVRLEVSASMQHSGLIMMSLLPINDSVDFQNTLASSAGNLVTYAHRSNLPHVTCRVGEGGYVDLDVPFIYPEASLQVPRCLQPPPLGNEYEPVVMIDTLSPVQTTLDSTDSVTINVFVFAKSISLGGTTSWITEAGGEPLSSKASAVAGSMLMMSDVMSSVPSLAIPLEIGGTVMAGVAGAARHFGHSRPVDSSVQAAVPAVSGSISTYNSNLQGRTLALDVDQGISVDGVIGGLGDRSHMLISDIISRPFFLGSMPMNNMTQTYEILYAINVGPQLFLNYNNQLAMGGGGLLSTLFRNWYGSMHYKFDFIVPPGTGGIIEVLYEPFGSFATSVEIANNPSVRINLREKKSLEITVHWQNNRGCLATLLEEPASTIDIPSKLVFRDNQFNGQLYVRMVAPLIVPGTSSVVNMDVIVWGWCDPKMIFWDYGPNGLANYIIPNAENTILGYMPEDYDIDPLPTGTNFAPMLPKTPEHGTKPGGAVPQSPTVAGPTKAPLKSPSVGPVKAPTKQPSISTKTPTKTPIRPPSKQPQIVPTPTPVISPTVTCPPTTITRSLKSIVAAASGIAFIAGSGTKQTGFAQSGHVYMYHGTYEFSVPYAYGGASAPVIAYKNYGSPTTCTVSIDGGTPIDIYSATDTTVTVAVAAKPLPAGQTYGYTNFKARFDIQGPGSLSFTTITTMLLTTPSYPSGVVQILFSAMWYTLGTNATQVSPTTGSYTADDGTALTCAEFPVGAQIGFTLPSQCIPMATFDVVIVGEGTISQITTVNGTSVPVFTGTTTLGSALVTKTRGVDIPNFPPDIPAFKVGGTAGSLSAVRCIYAFPN